MKKSANVVVAGLSLATSGALAMDWTMKARLNETMEIGDNYYLASPPSGTLYVSTSTLGLDAIGRTPTMRFEVNSSANYRAYEGAAASNPHNTLGTYNHLGVEKDDDSLTTYHVGASYRTQEVAAAQLSETGVVTATGLVNTALAEGGLKRELSQTDTMHLSGRVTSTAFTAAGSSPYTDVLATGDWNHRVNRAAELNTLLQFDWLSYDNASRSQIVIAKATQGIKSELTNGLTLKATAGGAFVDGSGNTTDGQFIPSNPFSATQLIGGTSFDWIGDMNVAYKLSKGDDLSVFAAKTIGPTVIGQILAINSFGTTLQHRINELSAITFWSQYSVQRGLNGNVDLAAASATYHYKLTPEWQAALSYTFRELLNTGAKANTFILSVTRDATIMP
jgi:hypothetical protein